MAKVILCGAGCLDASLLTVQAREAIEKADVILHDDLIPKEILKLNTRAEIIDVGKRLGDHRFTQSEICQLLEEKAENYNIVVRLKGGDPFIFGRGMEEMEYLESRGIEVEVIPGLSSAFTLPELLHLPLTHRTMSDGCMVVTAHHKDGAGLSQSDLQAASSFKGSLVILMGFSLAELICNQLKDAGFPSSKPAALIYSHPIGKVSGIAGTLETLPDLIARSDSRAPGILVVSDTVPFMKEKTAESGFKPDKPDELSEVDGKKKIKLGLFCTETFRDHLLPYLGEDYLCTTFLEPEIFSVGWPGSLFRKDVAEADWLVFCSIHGAQLFLETCKKEKVDLRSLKNIACIGPATASPFEQAGIYPQLICQDPSTLALGEELIQYIERHPKQSGSNSSEPLKIVTFRSAQADGRLESLLKRQPFYVKRIMLYALHYPDIDFEKESERKKIMEQDGFVFASPSCVEIAERDGFPFEKTGPFFCLSSVSAGRFPKQVLDRVIISQTAQAFAMAKAIRSYYENRQEESDFLPQT